MKFKLAKQSLVEETKEIGEKELIELIKEKSVVFLDSSNKEEDVKKLITKLSEFKVLVNIVKYGLAEGEYIYEVHII